MLLTFDFEEWERVGLFNDKNRRVVDILTSRNVPATFFLDANTAVHYPEAVKLLRKSGFELALHSDYHFGVANSHDRRLDFSGQDSETQVSRIRNAIAMVRKVIPDYDPKGFRAPGLKTNTALYHSLAKLGFLYDSSRLIGNKFRPFLENKVVVFPVNCGEFDSTCYQFGPHFTVNAWRDRFNKALFKATRAGESYFVLLMHPCVIGRIGYTAMLKAIIAYIDWAGQNVDIRYQACEQAAIEYLEKVSAQERKGNNPPIPQRHER